MMEISGARGCEGTNQKGAPRAVGSRFAQEQEAQQPRFVMTTLSPGQGTEMRDYGTPPAVQLPQMPLMTTAKQKIGG